MRLFILTFLLACFSAVGQPMTLNDPAFVFTQKPLVITNYSPDVPVLNGLILQARTTPTWGSNSGSGHLILWADLSGNNNSLSIPSTNCMGLSSFSNAPWVDYATWTNPTYGILFTNYSDSSGVTNQALMRYTPGSAFITNASYTAYAVAMKTNITLVPHQGSSSRVLDICSPDNLSQDDYDNETSWVPFYINDQPQVCSLFNFVSTALNIPSNTPSIMVAKFSCSAGTATITTFSVVGGVVTGVTNVCSDSTPTLNADAILVGKGIDYIYCPGSPSSYSGLNGSISEIILYNRLTDTNVGIGSVEDATIISYLRTKYGL